MPDDPPPPSPALAVGIACAIVVIAACTGIDRVRRVWRRVWWATGDALIVAGSRMAPPLPPELDTPEANAARRARITAAVAAGIAGGERPGVRRNGAAKGKSPL